MSKLVFPDGVTFTYNYITAGDILPKNFSGPIPLGLYRYVNNAVVKINFDTKSLTDATYMFQTLGGSNGICGVELFDTSNVTDMSSMFAASNNTNSAYIYIPHFNTSNVTDMSSMFYYRGGLVEVPHFDTGNVTDMSNMFYGCNNLVEVPHFNTSNVTNMSYMFFNCSRLITVPHFNTSNVTNMSSMFYGCSSLVEVPHFDTGNVNSMNNMFQGCSRLTTLPQLDCSKISSGSNMNIFSSTTMTYLTDLGGFKDLGKVSSFSKPSNFLRYCANLTKESVLNVLNNLYDRASAGYSVVTLPFNSASLALLSDEEKAIATNKGWTLATS